ncbi:MAG: amino acid kinase family protein, partial [Planctomycetota bacterium]
MPAGQTRKRIVEQVKQVVVKIGTNAICGADGRVNRQAVEDLAAQIATARAGGLSVTLVASGAIAAGMGELDLSERPKTMPMLQGIAAIGQGELMRTFHDAFAKHDIKVAQVLLTRDDFEDRTRYL